MPRFSRASLGLATTAVCVLLAPVAVRAEASPTNVHVVQAGDTLLQIALDAGTDTGTIVALNGLDDPNLLSVGQTLKLPARAAAMTAGTSAGASAPPASAAAPATASSYTIASGDTLWDIAQHFGTTSDAIVQLNHLGDADHVSVGTVLSIPAGGSSHASSTQAPAATAGSASAAATSTSNSATASAASGTSSTSNAQKRSVMVPYTVQPGETLVEIARRYNVRPDAIVQATNLGDANKIVVGSVLEIPVAAREHVVSDGETLRDIASSEKVDLGSLIDLNQIDDPSMIHVGQVVLLPVAATQANTRPTPAATPATAQTQADAPGQAAASVPAQSATPQAGSAQAAAASTAGSSTPTSPAPSATPAASVSPKPAPTPSPAPKPAAPVKTVAVSPGAPSEGLAAAAVKLLGDPYVWGGSTPSGFDCSGFVWYVARQLNKQVSRGMLGQYNSGSHPSRDDLKPGDLVFFQNTWAPGLSHNGVYIGDSKFVNAADEASGVTISNLNSAYWSAHWFGATRLP